MTYSSGGVTESSDAGRIEVSAEGRAPADQGASDLCLHQLVEAQARRTPTYAAVTAGQRILTYRDLDERANDVAHHLRTIGVAADDRVALCCTRSFDMAVGFLAILKAGGACVPLEPAHPPGRLRFIVEDADVCIVLTQGELSQILPADRTTVFLDADSGEQPASWIAPPEAAVDPDDLAYLLYTSGSTGRPKGVALTHRGLVNHTSAMSRLFDLRADDRVLQFASIAFDLSVEELFPTWHAGAAVVLRPPDLPVLGREWLEWLRLSGVTVMDLPTGYWERWVQELSVAGEALPDRLRLLIVGGEQPSPKAYAAWLDAGGDRVRWLNTYGPTEASVVATWYEPPRRPVDRIPIGRPIENVTACVLDAQMAPLPPGTAGELYLGGIGLARGYFGHPGATALCFVADPFSADPGARLFRTGDLVRQHDDANIEFLGRIDHQLKIRGVRVEPGEVQTALMAHPAVTRAVVVGREDASGELRLVAYCVAQGALPPPSELRAFLGLCLPDQLVPSAFIALEELPLTANGKVDRAALASMAPTGRPALGTRLMPPRTATEAVLATVWAEVLGLDEVGVDDNFFDLGGHSLLALQVAFEAQQRLEVHLPAHAVMQAPTVASLARLADLEPPRTSQVPPPIVALDRDTNLRAPLSLQQEWLWALETKADPPGLYNLTVHDRFVGPVKIDALRDALRYLVRRHETLRTIVCSGQEGPCTAATAADIEMDELDLTGLTEDRRESELQRRVASHNGGPFSLSSGPLFRAMYCRTGDDGSGTLVLTCDHLIADGVSLGVLLHEARKVYDDLVDGRVPRLCRLAVQYSDFAVWQRRWVTDDRLKRETSYWIQRLAGMPLGPGIPFDRQPTASSKLVRVRYFQVDNRTYRRLKDIAHNSGTSLFPVCVAAVQALISLRSGQTDVVVSSMLSGRHRRELEGVVGLFSGAIRLRTDLSGDPTFLDLLGRVGTTLLQGLENQNVPFGRVREALLGDRQNGDGIPSELGFRSIDLPVDVQYFPSTWGSWQPGSTIVARHPRHGDDQHYFERGQRHPIMVDFFDDRREMWAALSYKSALYKDATIDEIVFGLGTLLARVADCPARPISRSLPLS